MTNVDNNFLIDLEFGIKTSNTGDIEQISGLANLKQALFNRLVTVKGSLAHRPEYGVGVQMWQGDINSIDKKRKLANEIKNEFEKDARVASLISVSFEESKEVSGQFTITYKVEAVGLGQVIDTVNPFGEITI